MNGWLNRCHFGDVREVLRRMIADGVRVNTIVTSPPYWGLRDYGHPGQIGLEPTVHEFIATIVEVFDLCRQVLADDGTAWVNMGDSYSGTRGAAWGPSEASTSARMTASRRRDDHPVPRNDVRVAGLKPKDLVGQPWRLAFALQDAGWWLRQDIIWSKPNPMPESVRDRCTKAHEYIFLLSKSEKYYFDQEAILEPVSPNTHARLSQDVQAQVGSTRANGGAKTNGNMKAVGRGTGVGWGYTDTDPKPRARKVSGGDDATKNNASFDRAMAIMPNERNRRSVWTVATEAFKGAHFATYPTKLIEPCILAGAPAGGIVLDPFFGSGTTGQVAQQLGRQFIGIELNPEYAPLQAERLRQLSLNLEPA